MCYKSVAYFKEKANNYHVMAAGSLLGTLPAQPVKRQPDGPTEGADIIPIEVKAGEDKSVLSAEHNPRQAIRFSKRGYRTDGSTTNISLYLARKTKELL